MKRRHTLLSLHLTLCQQEKKKKKKEHNRKLEKTTQEYFHTINDDIHIYLL